MPYSQRELSAGGTSTGTGSLVTQIECAANIPWTKLKLYILLRVDIRWFKSIGSRRKNVCALQTSSVGIQKVKELDKIVFFLHSLFFIGFIVSEC